MKVDWNKLNLFDKFFYIIIFILLFVIFFGIIFFVYYFTFYQIKITPQDTTIISKCSTCNNLIITKADKNGICKWSNSCEAFKNYKYLARIVTPNDLDYQIFKLKYDFYNNKGKNFNNFNEWYKRNKDKKFYKFVKKNKYKNFFFSPKISIKPINMHMGKTYRIVHKAYIERIDIISYNDVGYIVKYVDNTNKNNKIDGFKKVDCDIIEYYIQVIERH